MDDVAPIFKALDMSVPPNFPCCALVLLTKDNNVELEWDIM